MQNANLILVYEPFWWQSVYSSFTSIIRWQYIRTDEESIQFNPPKIMRYVHLGKLHGLVFDWIGIISVSAYMIGRN